MQQSDAVRQLDDIVQFSDAVRQLDDIVQLSDADAAHYNDAVPSDDSIQ